VGKQSRSGRRFAILSYHSIGAPPHGVWEPWFHVPETLLAEHLQVLTAGGWEVIDLAMALRGLSQPELLPARSALLTFDDGYRSVLERAAPVLAERGCPGVAFVPIISIGRTKPFDEDTGEPLEPICDWDELRELEAHGISVQSHGVRHVAFSELEPREIVDELVVSKRVLEERLDKTVDAFAFPYGDGGRSTAQVTGALQRSGYAVAFLYGGGPVTPGVDDRYRLSRLAIGLDSDLAAELARASDEAR
jgi:peptidoglycan/xylan/chitin deacetylase (PgdA/CDA1 family)